MLLIGQIAGVVVNNFVEIQSDIYIFDDFRDKKYILEHTHQT